MVDYSGVVNSIIQSESGGNPNARNPHGSAGGLGQFIDSTWLAMIQQYRPDLMQGRTRDQILALKFDPALSREMTHRAVEGYASTFQRAGIPATPGNLYLAHFFGPQGAIDFLRQNPNTPVESFLSPEVIAANRSVLAGRTVGDVMNWASSRMGSASSARTPAPAPTPVAGGVMAYAPSTQTTAAVDAANAMGAGGQSMPTDPFSEPFRFLTREERQTARAAGGRPILGGLAEIMARRRAGQTPIIDALMARRFGAPDMPASSVPAAIPPVSGYAPMPAPPSASTPPTTGYQRSTRPPLIPDPNQPLVPNRAPLLGGGREYARQPAPIGQPEPTGSPTDEQRRRLIPFPMQPGALAAALMAQRFGA